MLGWDWDQSIFQQGYVGIFDYKFWRDKNILPDVIFNNPIKREASHEEADQILSKYEGKFPDFSPQDVFDDNHDNEAMKKYIREFLAFNFNVLEDCDDVFVNIDYTISPKNYCKKFITDTLQRLKELGDP